MNGVPVDNFGAVPDSHARPSHVYWGGLLTTAQISDQWLRGQELWLPSTTVVTPEVRDVLRRRGVLLRTAATAKLADKKNGGNDLIHSSGGELVGASLVAPQVRLSWVWEYASADGLKRSGKYERWLGDIHPDVAGNVSTVENLEVLCQTIADRVRGATSEIPVIPLVISNEPTAVLRGFAKLQSMFAWWVDGMGPGAWEQAATARADVWVVKAPLTSWAAKQWVRWGLGRNGRN
jgi:hypothetical protein